jgi:hypothetical protein
MLTSQLQTPKNNHNIFTMGKIAWFNWINKLDWSSECMIGTGRVSHNKSHILLQTLHSKTEIVINQNHNSSNQSLTNEKHSSQCCNLLLSVLHIDQIGSSNHDLLIRITTFSRSNFSCHSPNFIWTPLKRLRKRCFPVYLSKPTSRAPSCHSCKKSELDCHVPPFSGTCPLMTSVAALVWFIGLTIS